MGLYDADGRIRLTLSPGAGAGRYAPDGSWYYTPATGSGFLGSYAPDGSLYLTDATGSSAIGYYAANGSIRVTTGSDNNGALKVSGLYVAASQDIFSSFTTPPSITDKANINNLVVTLQNASIWDSLDILYLLAAADSNAAGKNWKAPGSFALNPVNSPTFTAYRGYQGNGTSSYLDTGWVPSSNGVNYTLNNASAWVWVRNSIAPSSGAVGRWANPVLSVYPRQSGNLIGYINNASTSGVSSTIDTSIGFSGVQRRSSTDVRTFKNGVQQGTGSIASTGLPAASVWGLGANSVLFSTAQEAVIAFGSSFSGKELTFYNAILTYLQAVGAA